jgi:hypothetical protein
MSGAAAGHGNNPGGGWDGYATPAHQDGKPLDAEFAALFPPGTVGAGAQRAPGGKQEPKRTLVYDPPSRTGNRPSPKVPGKKKRKPKKAKPS